MKKKKQYYSNCIIFIEHKINASLLDEEKNKIFK